MTHTLNRRGLSEDKPGEEIVVLFMINQHEIEKKQKGMAPIVETVLKYKPDNIIGAPTGMTEEQLGGNLRRSRSGRCRPPANSAVQTLGRPSHAISVQ